MSKMMWVASGLAVGLGLLVAVLWIAPGEQTTSAPKRTGPPAKVDKQLAAEGKQVAESNGCMSCHTTDGRKSVGPSFQGSYATEAELSDGKQVKVNAAYLRESILDPSSQTRSGFSPSMPSFEGKLSDQQVGALVEYIKSL